MVGWHHQLNGHEFEQVPGVGDGQGILVCCSPWGHKELDMTEKWTRWRLESVGLCYMTSTYQYFGFYSAAMGVFGDKTETLRYTTETL